MQTTKRWMNEFLCPTIILAIILSVSVATGQAPPATATSTAPAVPMPPADPMAVLKVIPADATAFVVFRNLRELDKDIQQLAAPFGIPMGPNGIYPFPLDMLKMYAGITGGLSENSSLALVVLNCGNVPSVKELVNAGKAAMLVPCYDVKALTASMAAEKEGDLLKINLFGQEFNAAPRVISSWSESPKRS